MHLVLVGLSHHHAPIAVREQLSCSDAHLPRALTLLSGCPGVREGILLSTCNRMEIYAVVEGVDVPAAYRALEQYLARFHNLSPDVFAPYLFHEAESDAVTHLLRVASGLDSLVLGEAQILGQVKTALRVAKEANAIGPTLSKMFAQAISTGKRVRSETGLSKGGFSIGHAAVGLASRILDDFSRARVLILGAGKMSELTARHLKHQGVQFVVVANRTYDKAVALAQRLGGQAIAYDQFPEELKRADIVISSTAAPHPIVRREMLAPIMKQRRGKPLFLIDIALPRDIDPDVNSLDNVYLRNIDDLQSYVAEDAQLRSGEAAAAEKIVTEDTAAFAVWRRSREAVPVVAQLRSQLDDMVTARLEILRRQLGPQSERDWRILETQLRALMDQVALEPTRRLMHAAGSQASEDPQTEAYDLLSAARELFGLRETDETSRPLAPLPPPEIHDDVPTKIGTS